MSATGLFMCGLMGLANAGSDVAKKKLAGRVSVSWSLAVRSALTVPLLFAVAMSGLDWDLPRAVDLLQGPDFQWALLVSGSLNLLTSLLMLHGLRDGDLSNTLPFLTLTPCCVLISAWALLGEVPQTHQTLGVLAITGGGVALTADSSDEAAQRPFRGGWFCVIALVWAVTSPFDKQGSQAATPALYAACMSSIIGVGAAVLEALQGRRRPRRATPWVWMAVYSLSSMAAYLLQLSAAMHLPVAVVSALKRVSAVLGVLSGWAVFGEPLGRRLLPAALMVGGAAVVAR
eukprot:TRINITY_DN17840_c0_g1_i1.p1 TRINITY_DN17840_c0_g1~~TRINITY_DN17840_c0_g1_i1.p1  ORF type:complete len:288 (+),score=66.48 TRINITY_DN17840_c0_g1_i1:52-915(+)